MSQKIFLQRERADTGDASDGASLKRVAQRGGSKQAQTPSGSDTKREKEEAERERKRADREAKKLEDEKLQKAEADGKPQNKRELEEKDEAEPPREKEATEERPVTMPGFSVTSMLTARVNPEAVQKALGKSKKWKGRVEKVKAVLCNCLNGQSKFSSVQSIGSDDAFLLQQSSTSTAGLVCWKRSATCCRS